MNALNIANMLRMNTVETIYLAKASDAVGMSPAEFVLDAIQKNLHKKGSFNLSAKKRGKSAAVKA